MYNGIGLTTPRGSGTNGYITRNLSHIPASKEKVKYRTEEEIKRADAALNRGPNIEILNHEKKRKVELKCLELRDLMEDQGYSADEIDKKVEEYRDLLVKETPLSDPATVKVDEYGRPIAMETHAMAMLQNEKNARLRAAFGIRDDFVEGSSMDRIKRQMAGDTKKLEEKAQQIVLPIDEPLFEEKRSKRREDISEDSEVSERPRKKHKHRSSKRKRKQSVSGSENGSESEKEQAKQSRHDAVKKASRDGRNGEHSESRRCDPVVRLSPSPAPRKDEQYNYSYGRSRHQGRPSPSPIPETEYRNGDRSKARGGGRLSPEKFAKSSDDSYVGSSKFNHKAVTEQRVEHERRRNQKEYSPADVRRRPLHRRHDSSSGDERAAVAGERPIRGKREQRKEGRRSISASPSREASVSPPRRGKTTENHQLDQRAKLVRPEHGSDRTRERHDERKKHYDEDQPAHTSRNGPTLAVGGRSSFSQKMPACRQRHDSSSEEEHERARKQVEAPRTDKTRQLSPPVSVQRSHHKDNNDSDRQRVVAPPPAVTEKAKAETRKVVEACESLRSEDSNQKAKATSDIEFPTSRESVVPVRRQEEIQKAEKSKCIDKKKSGVEKKDTVKRQRSPSSSTSSSSSSESEAASSDSSSEEEPKETSPKKRFKAAPRKEKLPSSASSLKKGGAKAEESKKPVSIVVVPTAPEVPASPPAQYKIGAKGKDKIKDSKKIKNPPKKKVSDTESSESSSSESDSSSSEEESSADEESTSGSESSSSSSSSGSSSSVSSRHRRQTKKRARKRNASPSFKERRRVTRSKSPASKKKTHKKQHGSPAKKKHHGRH